jgi:hypothetical protein
MQRYAHVIFASLTKPAPWPRACVSTSRRRQQRCWYMQTCVGECGWGRPHAATVRAPSAALPPALAPNGSPLGASPPGGRTPKRDARAQQDLCTRRARNRSAASAVLGPARGAARSGQRADDRGSRLRGGCTHHAATAGSRTAGGTHRIAPRTLFGCRARRQHERRAHDGDQRHEPARRHLPCCPRTIARHRSLIEMPVGVEDEEKARRNSSGG